MCTYLNLSLPQCSCVCVAAGWSGSACPQLPLSACPVTSSPSGPDTARQEGAGLHTRPFSPFYLQPVGSSSSSARYKKPPGSSTVPGAGRPGRKTNFSATGDKLPRARQTGLRGTRRSLLSTHRRCPGEARHRPAVGPPRARDGSRDVCSQAVSTENPPLATQPGRYR